MRKKIRTMRRFWIWVMCFLFCKSLLFADAGMQFEKANRAFQKGDFAAAIELYESVLKENFFSAKLYNTLGTAYHESGKTGKPILFFERAQLLDPADADLLHNLEIARLRTKDEFSSLPEFFISRWWKAAAMLGGVVFWTMLSVLFWWAGLGLWSLFYFEKINISKSRLWMISGMCLLLASLFFLQALTRKNEIENNRRGIVLVPEATLRSAPEDDSAEVTKVHEGAKIIVEDELGDWIKVRLPNGETGWLLPSDFEQI